MCISMAVATNQSEFKSLQGGCASKVLQIAGLIKQKSGWRSKISAIWKKHLVNEAEVFERLQLYLSIRGSLISQARLIEIASPIKKSELINFTTLESQESLSTYQSKLSDFKN